MIKIVTPLDQIDSTVPMYTVGSRVMTKEGNEYIYLPGVASVAKYDWVVMPNVTGFSYGSVSRLATTSVGHVGVAQAAITNGKWGWFQIGGIGWAHSADATGSGSAMYACGTTGYATGSITSGDLIGGAFAGQIGAAGGTILVKLVSPFITQTLS